MATAAGLSQTHTRIFLDFFMLALYAIMPSGVKTQEPTEHVVYGFPWPLRPLDYLDNLAINANHLAGFFCGFHFFLLTAIEPLVTL